MVILHKEEEKEKKDIAFYIPCIIWFFYDVMKYICIDMD